MTFVSPLPSALTTKSRSRPAAFRTKTRRRPSGDHAGSRSFWSVVTRFGLEPSALTYQMPPVEPTEFWKAIRLPSGAHAGEVGTNPRARPITRRLSDPSGLTVESSPPSANASFPFGPGNVPRRAGPGAATTPSTNAPKIANPRIRRDAMSESSHSS